MWPFRRKVGRHELGAAVTALPSLGVTPALRPAYEVPVAAGPRVELGFRDGSTAELVPGSAQARALTALASVLAQRD